MLNNAWPSLIWHLYDYYLRPGGGYFGTKKACEPLHVQYSYDDRSIAVVNSYYKDFHALTISAKVYNLDLTEKFSREAKVDVSADGVVKPFVIPQIEGLSTTYFVRLTLTDESGKQVSSNFYWLSTKPDKLAWDRSTWYYTPTTSQADFTSLQSLPKVDLRIASTIQQTGRDQAADVTVENPSHNMAFLVHLKVLQPLHDPDDEGPAELKEVLPVLWQDNYVSLMPGEKRELTATFRAGEKPARETVVQVDGWNVPESSVQAVAASQN